MTSRRWSRSTCGRLWESGSPGAASTSCSTRSSTDLDSVERIPLDVGQQVLDDLHELVMAHRFHHHRGGSELLGALTSADVAGSGEDHNPGARVLRSKANRLEELEAVGVQRRIKNQDFRLE